MTKPFHAMLAATMPDHRLETLLRSPDWAMQEKCDGHRVMVAVDNHKVTVYNRSGTPRQHAVPQFMIDSFSRVPFTATFDGELVGTGSNMVLWLFDLPRVEANGTPVVAPASQYGFRFHILNRFMAEWDPHPSIRVVPLASTEEEKRVLLSWADRDNREGVMFKKVTATYQHGRRSLNVLKYKFRQDGDVIVINKGVEGKDNLVLGAYHNGELIEVGHCTALNGDGAKINVGDVIMVNYVHFSKGNRLVQPTMPRIRAMGDKKPEECTTDQFRRSNHK